MGAERPDLATATVEPAPGGLPKMLVANPVLATWMEARPDGGFVLSIGKSELGQGISTAVAQIAAEELDVPVEMITTRAPSTRGPDEGRTSGSMSVADSGSAVRAVAANVRALFVAEAARQWSVPAREVEVSAGVLAHAPSGRTTSYAHLAGAVDLAREASPEVHSLPAAGSTPHDGGRTDLPDKVLGRPRFIADLRPEGLLYGRVVRPPSPGARLRELAYAEPVGVSVVRDGSFLAVVGEREADADATAAGLRAAAVWDEMAKLPDERMLAAHLRAGPHDTIVVAEAPPATGEPTLRRSYSRPFLAHGSIGTSCGIARWDDAADGPRVHVWSSTQGVFPLRAAMAKAFVVDADRIEVTHVENAGCYGHNGSDDAAYDAVLLARSFPGRPVQVRWTRDDELTWSPLGSAMVTDLEATLDQSGLISRWTADVYSHGHTSRPGYAGVPGFASGQSLATPHPTAPSVDPQLAGGGGTTRNAVPGYDIGEVAVRGHRVLTQPLRTSALRALGAHLNVFAIESMIDELAEEAGIDPVEFRLRHLSDERARAVVEAVAQRAGWGAPTPGDVGRGIAYARYKGKGAWCAVVAEVEASHTIRVRRLTLAVDVGRVVNLDGVRNQVEGGAVQATSWTLKEGVRFDRARVTSRDWETYQILRFSEVPEVDVVVLGRPEEPSVGAGEPVQGPTSAAIANAVAAAVGVRVRDLPLTPEAVVAVIEAGAP